jgi:predicted deacylase
MRIDIDTLPMTVPGQALSITRLRFGEEGRLPKVYIQAGLHADEAPGHLVAHHLREHLTLLEREKRIPGEIVLVPCANPIGLAQIVLGTLQGRFALADGKNFNRGFPDITDPVLAAIETRLGADLATNRRMVGAALKQAVAAFAARSAVEHLKKSLLLEAIDADLVLDLHCDGEAAMHLYTHTAQAADFEPLARYLGAKAQLFADVSGDNPFDEAISRPWTALAERFPNANLPRCGLATTIELRGEAEVDHALAQADAMAILDFLAFRGAIDRVLAAPPAPLCQPTPLAGSEALEAPTAGVIVYRREPGNWVEAGDLIAEILDPVAGIAQAVRARTTGMFYARTAARYAAPGRRLGKIAGRTPFRTGKLLSP